MPDFDLPKSLADLLTTHLLPEDVAQSPSERQMDAQAAIVRPRPAAPRPVSLAVPPAAIPAQIPSDAPALADVTPKPPPAPPPPSPQDSELADAQKKARSEQLASHTGAILNDAKNTMLSGWGIKPSGEETYARGEASAEQPVKDLLQKREQARQLTAEQAQKDLADPNSAISRRTQLLGAAMGLKGVTGMSAADFQRLGPLMEKGMSAEQAKAALDAENMRAANSLAGENQRSASAQANQLKLERERMAQERAMHLEDINAKNAADKKGQPKPLPPEIQQKIAGTVPGAQSLNQLWDSFDKQTGPGILPLGATGRYDTAKGIQAKDIAVAELPNAREQPGLVEQTVKELPSSINNRGNAAQNILGHFGVMQRKLEGELMQYKDGPFDTSGIERELQGVRDEKAKFLEKAGGHLGRVTVQASDGRTITVDAKGAAKYAKDPRFQIMGVAP